MMRVYGREDFRAFAPATSKGEDVVRCLAEIPSLGYWAGISGAAFTTGLGWRTSLGLSLLTGLANVRLGYWWDCGIERFRGGFLSWMLHKLLPVQAHLFDELTARFPGTSRQWWYLSDGGHFENLGGYELIRRGLRHIVLIDAEADPDYRFEGLANLIHKARVDFSAKIELDDLGDLRPSKEASEGTVYEGVLECSRAHAITGKITYADGRKGQLLYIKAAVTGDEPLDVQRYKVEHPGFPHESTGDQFFDESQWEAYRCLGQHAAERVVARLAQQPRWSWLATSTQTIPKPVRIANPSIQG